MESLRERCVVRWCTLISGNEVLVSDGDQSKEGRRIQTGGFVIHINGLRRLRACLLDNMSSS